MVSPALRELIAEPSPDDIETLLRRARSLAGFPLGVIAEACEQEVPEDLRKNKGWAGQLLESALGAEAGVQAIPDFPRLGVELKTLPIGLNGKPRESTYICRVSLEGSLASTWEESRVCSKTRKVLWVPLVAEPSIPLAERRVGTPLFWLPTQEDEATLKADWSELTDFVRLGQFDEITAHHGKILQIRPKAAHSRVEKWALGQDGDWVTVNPRGFYLRRSFTTALLERSFVLPLQKGT